MTEAANRRLEVGFTAPENGPTRLDAEQAAAEQTPAELFASLVASVRRVVFTEDRTVELSVACLLAGGHLLLEDHPGLGKTTLAKALARSLGLGFRRVQFTADLLPADITGAMLLDRGTGEPTFRPGPVFTNVLMADELNRASPRAQSALLEAMEEHQVTVDSESHRLPNPFMVVATQNPYDAAGTSPLPHGQRDRFLLRLSLGYPGRDEEDALLAGADPADVVRTLEPALRPEELRSLMAAARAVHVAPLARGYVLDLVEATRHHPAVAVGASPQAARAVLRAAAAIAVARDRRYVAPEDVQEVAVAALAHRILLEAMEVLSVDRPALVVEELVRTVPVPLAPGPAGGT